ncbi:BMP family ABC transporter substrate-binding protein [Actinacidiphila acidipaludis]|uniref:BMP family ABC transporter substrate-binding protein n=1 Tax=Actinacidiphila acidipaludis TaxID=2873382 RepID=A0ABS7Q128_9ACTN|nr:BMP family ABC transporter substrate-binding protein [Streptomyces acidipaludis]MBY8876849.1 BMP family ABC transporter substrate-binding protein [Streptomyces acidipaludis]
MKAWIRAHRRLLLMVGGGVAAAAAVTAIVVAVVGPGGSGRRQLPPARARVYTAQQACLLTGERGIADPAAAPVWAGMQEASASTHAKVTYLAMAGEQTPAAAGPYLSTLAARQCTVVLTVGAAPDGAAAGAGARFPHTRFVVVGASAGGPSNVTAVSGTKEAVASAVEAALAN